MDKLHHFECKPLIPSRIRPAQSSIQNTYKDRQIRESSLRCNGDSQQILSGRLKQNAEFINEIKTITKPTLEGLMCTKQCTLFPKCGQLHAGGLVWSVTYAPHIAHLWG